MKRLIEAVEGAKCVAAMTGAGVSTLCGIPDFRGPQGLYRNPDAERIFDFPNGQLRDTLFTLKKHYFNIYSHYGQTDKESSQTTERVVHIIKSGDTLGALARKYHTTVARLCSLNGISANKTLRLGQRIVVR